MNLSDLQERSLNILSQHLRPGERVALVDYPNHGNSGDSLIYLGQLEYLRRLGVHVDYVADATRYNASDLSVRVPDGTILINGGGNFGDRWEAMQAMRERVIVDFPDRKILQLPQGIEFSDGPRLLQAQRILGAHKRLVLLIRDSAGVSRARKLFPNAEVEFCPDLAFGIGPIRSLGNPEFDTVIVKRCDSESVGPDLAFEGNDFQVDWGLRGWRKVLGRALRIPGAVTKRIPRLALRLYPLQRWCYDALAQLHVNMAVWLLSRGRVVITDRLHATVIAALMDKPVVALDNANGKVSAICREYLGQLPGVYFVNDSSAAKKKVFQLLGG